MVDLDCRVVTIDIGPKLHVLLKMILQLKENLGFNTFQWDLSCLGCNLDSGSDFVRPYRAIPIGK